MSGAPVRNGSHVKKEPQWQHSTSHLANAHISSNGTDLHSNQGGSPTSESLKGHVSNDREFDGIVKGGSFPSTAEAAAIDASPAPREKRTRNKPSLSCEACTSKKTKCDRERPQCFACQKRRSECRYSQIANLIDESGRSSKAGPPRKKVRVQVSGHAKGRVPPETTTASDIKRHRDDPDGEKYGSVSPAIHERPKSFAGPDLSQHVGRASSRSSTVSAPTLLSNVPFSNPTIANVFKIEHPFSNYWTHQGGLGEVIGILPSKQQADILVAKYFDVVDPVYPLLHRLSFAKDYDFFWSIPESERDRSDGSLVALMFVMLAMGTQFVSMPSKKEKEQTAEFYISAAHQALRVINYLAQPTIRKMQTMVLVTYFLMNDNHASDAWAFAGILSRHASALGLNRDPSHIVPHATPFEKQQRRKLWQAILFQDTFFTVLLKLPPNTTHSDCRVDDLLLDDDTSTGVEGATDTTYVASMWRFANIVQPTICTPRALDLPIAYNAAERKRLVTNYDQFYTTLARPFRTFNEAAICDLAAQSRRLARQALFLTSNYYHCLMLIYADEHPDLELDIEGTLDAAHQAISSFFVLHKLFEDEARVWYHFQHRAFSEALIIAELIKNKGDLLATDPRRMKAKDDVFKMIGILGVMSENDIVARNRVSVLSKYL